MTIALAPLGADEAERCAAAAHAIVDQLGRVVLGQDGALRDVAAALIARGHVLLEGVPGTAKTLLVRTLSQVLRLEFRRIQFTPDLMPSDITGVNLLSGAAGAFTFRPGPIFGDLVLGDEINRAPAKTQAALLEAMQERRVTVDGVSHELPESFTVFATQNPIEFEGTYPLPEAELDRFLVKVVLDYPEEMVEQGILHRVLGGFEADAPESYGVDAVADAGGLAELREACRRVRVEQSLVAYVAAIVRATRSAPVLTLGASPRGSVALLKMAQAAALLEGRSYVVPDDVKALAPAVLRHRVTVAPELELEGVAPDTALRGIIEKIEAPR
ncbi:MAG TPA: MoxR family ATPase [Gemmatimonadales bacterium]|nr:MoxR family ATPase [Gemmatimonadales bacterium]